MTDTTICDGCNNKINDFPKVKLVIYETWCKNKTYHFCTKECLDKFIVLNGDLI